MKSLLRTSATAMLFGLVAFAGAQANHLVISEVGIGTTIQTADMSSEFVEIYNPTNQPVKLDNYYIADNNNYKNRSIALDGKITGNTTDNMVQFPAGTVLLPGQVAVVTGGATNFITEFFAGDKQAYLNQVNSPLLFEVGETDDTPNMIAHNNSSTRPVNFSITDPIPPPATLNGEFMIIAYWDGVTDTVKDVDMASWGALTTEANAWQPKAAPYLPDAGSHLSLMTTDSGKMVYRTSLIESGEVQTGGNGIFGQDESTELSADTWGSSSSITAVTPGVTNLGMSTAVVPPEITQLSRDKEFPSATDTIALSAVVTDGNNVLTASNVTFHVNAGNGWTEVPTVKAGDIFTATVGPYAEGTIVRYYVEATDADNATVIYPLEGEAAPRLFHVSNDHVNDTDVMINEIMYNVIGTDSYEWLELYNTRNTTVSLAGYRIIDDSGTHFEFPLDAEIGPEGYVIVTFNIANMLADVVVPEGTPMYKYNFSLGNTADTLNVYHANSVKWGAAQVPLDTVSYASSGDWPTEGDGTGVSLELKSPTLDNNIGGNWQNSYAIPDKNTGTPGARNTQASVAGWEVY